MAPTDDFDRVALQAELDQLQKQHDAERLNASAQKAAFPSGWDGVTEVFSDLSVDSKILVALERDGVTNILTPAERALAHIAAANRDADVSQIDPTGGHDELLLRKDGLDLTFNQMRYDAGRLRVQLSDIGLAMDQPRRSAALEKVKQMPLPPETIREFQDQQRLIVEQRRVLEELKRDRQLAEEEQWWLIRGNRLEYQEQARHGLASKRSAPTAACVNPLTLDDEQLRYRVEHRRDLVYNGQPEQMAPGLIIEPDGYLVVELRSISGLQPQRLRSARYILTVRDVGGAEVCQVGLEGPLDADGTTWRDRSIELTIPKEVAGSQLQIEVILEGPDGQAKADVPWPSPRSAPVFEDTEKVLLTTSGEWSDAKQAFLEASFRWLPPRDAAGRALAHTRAARAIEAPARSILPRSAVRGPEHLPSQQLVRDRARAWEQMGCPMPEDRVDPPKITAFAGVLDAGADTHHLALPKASQSADELLTQLQSQITTVGAGGGTAAEGQLAFQSVQLEVITAFAERVAQLGGDGLRGGRASRYAAALINALDTLPRVGPPGAERARGEIIRALAALAVSCCSSGDKRGARMGLPIFEALSRVAVDFPIGESGANSRDKRWVCEKSTGEALLKGLAASVSSDARVDAARLVPFVLKWAATGMAGSSTECAEWVLKVLCILGSPAFLEQQIECAFAFLRGSSSDTHFAPKALMAISVFYDSRRRAPATPAAA